MLATTCTSSPSQSMSMAPSPSSSASSDAKSWSRMPFGTWVSDRDTVYFSMSMSTIRTSISSPGFSGFEPFCSSLESHPTTLVCGCRTSTTAPASSTEITRAGRISFFNFCSLAKRAESVEDSLDRIERSMRRRAKSTSSTRIRNSAPSSKLPWIWLVFTKPSAHLPDADRMATKAPKGERRSTTPGYQVLISKSFKDAARPSDLALSTFFGSLAKIKLVFRSSLTQTCRRSPTRTSLLAIILAGGRRPRDLKPRSIRVISGVVRTTTPSSSCPSFS
mmetsp:Transcript_1059/g.1875  ORF Transcript_1059/g.1875 Transcript_1059/m.1875 type:complete len:277 (+) Transcript_1059:331-1161(+)